jgi:hypothetical protein
MLPSHSRRYQTHVDAPDETDKAEEDDAAVDGNEAEADDGGNGPDLVARHDDGDRLLMIRSVLLREA